MNPAYTSFIGNVSYNYSDPVNASLEVARRVYKIIILKNKKFYPNLTIDSLKNQWKEYLTDDVKDWKTLFNKIKNSKLRYRVSLDDLKLRSTMLKSIKSFVDVYSVKSHFGVA